jgi:hypothetical protein
MARHINPDSVSSKVSTLEVNEIIEFTNPYTSIAVMISNLKRKEYHKDKIFKIKVIENTTQVIRVR